MKLTFSYGKSCARDLSKNSLGDMPSLPKNPCMAGDRSFRGRPASHTTTLLRHRPNNSAPLKPAGPPPTMTTSFDVSPMVLVSRWETQRLGQLGFHARQIRQPIKKEITGWLCFHGQESSWGLPSPSQFVCPCGHRGDLPAAASLEVGIIVLGRPMARRALHCGTVERRVQGALGFCNLLDGFGEPWWSPKLRLRVAGSREWC